MAATIVFNATNITEAANADLVNFSTVKISGSGGAPSPVAENDVVKQGSDGTSNAVSIKVNKQRNILWFDIGAGNELDFTGTESGQMVFIWSIFLAAGLLLTAESVAAGGFGIALGSSVANYSLWNTGGNDKGTPSSWTRYAIDPTKTATTTGGTGLNTASVRYFGMFADVGGTTARFENLVVDRIDYGYGLQIYGTSTVDDLFQDIWDADEGTQNNKYGMIREDNGVFYIHGEYELGDDVGINGSTLTDIGKVIVYEAKEYWRTGGWINASVSGYNTLKRVGNATNGTALTLGDGILIQAGKGISGNAPAVSLNFDDAHVGAGADLTINGARFSGINGLLSLSENGAYTCDKTIFNDCIEVTGAGDAADGIVIRDSIFQNYSGESAALQWGDGSSGVGMDVEDCLFQNNNGGAASHAIRHTDGTTEDYTNLLFLNNDADVYLNHTDANLTINKLGTSDPTSYTSSGSGAVTFVGTKSLTINVFDPDGNTLADARVLMEAGATGDAPHDESVTITSSGTTASVSHTDHGMTNGQYVVIRGANEQYYNGVFTISNVSTNAYDYTMLGDPVDTATGTITATQVFMNELTVAGVATESFNYGTTQSYTAVIRKADGSPYFMKDATISGNITGDLTVNVKMEKDE